MVEEESKEKENAVLTKIKMLFYNTDTDKLKETCHRRTDKFASVHSTFKRLRSNL